MVDDFVLSYNGKYYQCLAMPFGWGPASFWFTAFLAPVISVIQRWGHRVLVYIDAVLLIPRHGKGCRERDCEKASRRIDWLLDSLGITKHPEKGYWGPGVTRALHLGFVMDTERLVFLVPEGKQNSIRNKAKALLAEVRCGRRWVTIRTLSKFLGCTTALPLAVPLARFYNRALYKSLKGKWKRVGQRLRVRLSCQAVNDLRWWRQLKECGRSMHPPPTTVTLHSDASDIGWGGTISLGPPLPPGTPGEREYQGLWDRSNLDRTILWRELFGLYTTLERVADILGEQRDAEKFRTNVLCYQDNSACRYTVQNMCTASDECMPLLRRLQHLLDHRRMALQMRWLPSAVNVHADRLSRSWDPRDIQLSRAALQLVKDIYRAAIGLSKPVFAYRRLAEHPIAQRKTALAALSQKWDDGLCRFFNPLIDLISVTLLKITRENAKGILIIPDWPNAIWYPTAKDMCSQCEIFPMSACDALCGARTIRNYWRLVVGVVGARIDR